MFRTHRFAFLALAALTATGCGTTLQPAGGQVLVDGVPVKEGTVMFYPTAKGRPATARIGEDGSFVLSYEKPGDGLPPGEYKVVIVADVFKAGPRTKQQEYDEANLKKQGIADTSTLT
ncbi:MAG: carboxypeptidase-like regulatory domain-containing protein, partial [Gemmataceae bacterium]|nr:carboxypeptidase-like regulatory domain-containing protein [Gemmataceae bacterium]